MLSGCLITAPGGGGCDEPPDFGADLTNGADVRQGIERDRDPEAVFEFADEFENLQRVEAQVGQEFAVRRGVDRPAAETLEHLKRLAFESIGGSRDGCGRGVCTRGM